MRSTHAKLAALGASAVVAALVAAAVAFNLFIGWKVESDAVGDIAYALGMDDEGGSTGRSPNYMLLDSAYAIDPREQRWTGEEEARLAAWFAANPEEYVIRHVTLGDWSCYAALVPESAFIDYSDEAFPDVAEAYATGHYVVYLDMASEQSLVATVNTAFVAIGVVGAVVAGAAGYFAGRRIEVAQESQKRFYENMSHDLKTPLAAIRGYAEGASSGVVDAAEATRAIVRETDRMTSTINEILGMARLEAGAVTPAKEPVEVADFVQDCLMPLEGAVRARGIEVRLELARGEVMADPGLFDHALSNVLTNAIRHADALVRIRYDGARLEVWNDGAVPDESELSLLFDRFHAGDGGSTGIGLAIAKEIATLHKWSVQASCVDDGLQIAFVF
ncbi:MAG: HAMP domain-containing histidine kinase [Atopobiaceae bacterium]|nr:HAMP domain-containing histidine kinase [Atopobiaceae bacterium]